MERVEVIAGRAELAQGLQGANLFGQLLQIVVADVLVCVVRISRWVGKELGAWCRPTRTERAESAEMLAGRDVSLLELRMSSVSGSANSESGTLCRRLRLYHSVPQA